MASNARCFQALARGVAFSTPRIQGDKQHFQKKADGSAALTHARDSELDFFGFDAAASKPARGNRKGDSTSKRERKISVDMIPSWAGNAPKKTSKKGVTARRKRRLSEGAIEEDKLDDLERRQASQQLAPKEDGSSKRKSRKRKKRSRSMSTEDASRGENAKESDDEEAADAVRLFKPSKHDKEENSANDAKKPITRASRDSEETRIFRKQMGIRVDGTMVPPPIATFEAMQLQPEQEPIRKLLLKNIEKSEYKEPTPIQMQAIPSMLLRRDVLATAPTGSGKTAAFAIPMLANLGSPKQQGIRSIVLSPTRELAVQICHEFERLCAGRKFQIVLLSKATAATIISHVKNQCAVHYDLLIATPLRLVHVLEQVQLDLSQVQMICLDEADRLFDMGFVEQIDSILAACTLPTIQRAMFSATMLQGVEELAHSVLRDPIQISIGTKNAGASTIDQQLVFVGKEEGKLVALKQLMHDGRLRIPALLFVQNKERAQQLFHELVYDGMHVGVVHADRSKEQRDETIRQFRVGQIWVLICTDLMSRGIDLRAVNMVINYDFPQDAVSYIHRIGRTGRNGRKGVAVTLFTEDDMQYLRAIANVMKLSGCEVPDWMLKLKKASASKRKQFVKAPPQRKRISTVSGYDLQKAHKLQQVKKSTATPSE